MGSDQFGVELQELAKVQQDWHTLSERLGDLNKRLGTIKEAITRATEVDLATCAISGVVGFGVAYEVMNDVKDIANRAEALNQTKEQLTKELADDAQKIKGVVAEYTEIEKKIEEELKKKITQVDPPKAPQPPRTGLDGGGGGGGHHGGGGGGGGGGHHGGGGGEGSGGSDNSGAEKDSGKGDFHWRGNGQWKTTTQGGWDAWSPGKHHTTEGAGVQTAPKLDGVPPERKDILDRALDRINHRIGYSQSGFTNGYRDDCSGFVSAAWGVKPPGTNTYGLMDSGISHRVSKDDLQPGDALIAGGHTVLFGGWADASHSHYIALEDNGSQGTVSHVIPYPYYGNGAGAEGRPYLPYRRNQLS